jgi:zinc protease
MGMFSFFWPTLRNIRKYDTRGIKMKKMLLTIALMMICVLPSFASNPIILKKPANKQMTLQVKTCELKDSKVISALHSEVVRYVPTNGAYVIVVSDTTYSDPNWRNVVKALAIKHNAETVIYSGNVSSVRDELINLLPRYVCFVAKPEESGRLFVIKVHQLMRSLASAPYTDAIWGILTGYDAGDAARIVAQSAPLVVRKGAGGTSIDLNLFDQGIWYDEGRKNHMAEKKLGGKPEDKECPQDTAKALAEMLNTYQPDFFQTSGHASERNWAIGYSYPNGMFVCKNGILMGRDMKGNLYPICSPNPKIYAPVGNCLMGHIPDKQSMALAYMSSGGVDQMMGYTVETWYGYGGWGVMDYFLGQPGRFTYAESFFLNNEALEYQIQKRFPDKANYQFSDWKENQNTDLNEFAASLGTQNRDELGLFWDRDTVAFYGDPSWSVRMEPQNPAWTEQIKSKGDTFTFEVHALQDAAPGRPIAALLPERLKLQDIIEGSEYSPIITGNFIMLPALEKLVKGETYKVVFHARRINHVPQKAVSEEYRPDVQKALDRAGENRIELIAALRLVPANQRKGMAFLISNMPDIDLTTLDRYFLLQNSALAYQSRIEFPWAKSVPDKIFLNDVLPYANLDEQRTAWRQDMYNRFGSVVEHCKSAGEAAVELNKAVFESFHVKYSATKRPKPNQSPYESAAAHYASCTGLSILLADACRSVGIPARVTGTPLWMDDSGNHTWVEIWERGKWHFLDAASGDPLDKSWFTEKAAQANPADPEHGIYAASFQKTKVYFPLVWNRDEKWVSAENVSRTYRKPTAIAQ